MIGNYRSYQQISADVVSIRDAVIEDYIYERRSIIMTVSYFVMENRRPAKKNISLILSPATVLKQSNGNSMNVRQLKIGMKINALVSSTVTKSTPPQTKVYMITVVGGERKKVSICTGKIVEFDQMHREISVVPLGNRNRRMKFPLERKTIVLNREGGRMNYLMLKPEMLVRIEFIEMNMCMNELRKIVSSIQLIS